MFLNYTNRISKKKIITSKLHEVVRKYKKKKTYHKKATNNNYIFKGCHCLSQKSPD